MNTKWFKGLKTKDEKDKRKKELLSYRTAYEALIEILEEKTSTPDYDCPSWSHKQADQNGYNQAIKEVKALITFKD